jgi:tetratricopeptide (TPR) repeat protein
MKKCISILMLSVSLTAWAQKQPAKTEQPKTQPQTQTQTQPQATQQQGGVSPLTEHFYKKYVTAIKWNDFEVAKSALYDLIVENPLNDSLILSLAYHYYENEQHVPAVLVSQQLLARNPKNTAALEISAIGYEYMGVRDRALQNFESLYLLSNNINTLYKMAFLQYDLKRFNEAITSIDILLSKSEVGTLKVVFNDAENKPKEYPMTVALYNLKGLAVLDHLGDKEAAKKLFDQALATAPDFVLAKQNLSKVK